MTADPEFRSRVRAEDLQNVVDPGAYRRILANPFPGLLALVAWLWGMHTLLTDPPSNDALWPLAAFLLLPFGWLVLWMFRYQCLDCGSTGPLHQWKRHLCPPVARRILNGRKRPWRGPPPGFQVVLWLFWFCMALLLVRGQIPMTD